MTAQMTFPLPLPQHAVIMRKGHFNFLYTMYDKHIEFYFLIGVSYIVQTRVIFQSSFLLFFIKF